MVECRDGGRGGIERRQLIRVGTVAGVLPYGHQRLLEIALGLALFGPAEPRSQLPDNIVIGTPDGIELWKQWCAAI